MNKYLDKEKEYYLSLVAYGGHKATISKINKYLRYEVPEGIGYCFFLEYLLLDPILINSAFKGIIFCPFLERMIKEQRFLPNWQEVEINITESVGKLNKQKTQLFPRTRDLEKYFVKKFIRVKLESGGMSIGQNIYKKWNKNKGELAIYDQSYGYQDFIKQLEKIKKIKDPESKEGLFKEITSVIYSWVKNAVISYQSPTKLQIVGIPIASNKLFYGYVLIAFPYDKNKNKIKERTEVCHSIGKNIKEQIVDFYLPALILCHHSFYEQICVEKKKIENVPFLFNSLKESNDVLERNLHFIWSLRKTKEKGVFKDDSHFIFRKFFWGSPETIKKIKEAFTWDTNFGQLRIRISKAKNENKIKTFLIIGSPGSGKETISKMIGLFSTKHTFSKPHVFNMAALKPNWLAPPALAGIEIRMEKNKQYSLYGLFRKVLEENKKSKKWPIIILDELNSLDIDAQGVLLRILENNELVPIGGIEPYNQEDVRKLLVIGVVNELPPQLTMEHISKVISQDRDFFGELLSSALYDSFRKMRRLREDLFHRFERGGFIELPNLDDRREDIPIIFFASLPEDLKEKIVERVVPIEYDIWDLLTSEKIEWGGNIRQLQAVAHKIAQEINKNKLKGRKEQEINVPMVKKILIEMKLLREA
jgi:hypothetical protein